MVRVWGSASERGAVVDRFRSPTRPSIAGTSGLFMAQVASFAGLVTFVAAVTALHFLRRELNPAEHTISEYSLGDYGWLMRGAFASLGVNAFATAAGLRVGLELSGRRRVGMTMLVLSGIGLLLDAGYNTDRPGIPQTPLGRMHGIGMLIICLTLPAATCTLGSELMKTSVAALRPRLIRALGMAQLIAVLGFRLSPIAWRGVTERLAIAFAVSSLALLEAVVIARIGADASSVGSEINVPSFGDGHERVIAPANRDGDRPDSIEKTDQPSGDVDLVWRYGVPTLDQHDAIVTTRAERH